MEVCRIVGEVKRGDELLGERGADEKVSRYNNSRQATVLGKWTVHSALREETQGRQRGPRGEQPLAKKEDRFVYSLSPIVIQQDLYCVSTTSSAGKKRSFLVAAPKYGDCDGGDARVPQLAQELGLDCEQGRPAQLQAPQARPRCRIPSRIGFPPARWQAPHRVRFLVLFADPAAAARRGGQSAEHPE